MFVAFKTPTVNSLELGIAKASMFHDTFAFGGVPKHPGHLQCEASRHETGGPLVEKKGCRGWGVFFQAGDNFR